MKVIAKVKAGAGKNSLETISPGEVKIHVTAPPEKGRANQMVIRLIADHFEVAPSLVRIIGGKTATTKIIEIAE